MDVATRFAGRKNRENCADRNIDIDVARAIKRIKKHEVGAHFAVFRHAKRVIHFFAGNAAHQAAFRAGAAHDVIGNDVEFFLRFALNIFASGRTQNAC